MYLFKNQDGRTKRIFSAKQGQIMTVILLIEFQTPGTTGKKVRPCFKANIFIPCLNTFYLSQFNLALIFRYNNMHTLFVTFFPNQCYFRTCSVFRTSVT